MRPIEVLQPDQLADALACLLAAPGTRQAAGPEQVRGFLDYVRNSALEWEGLRCDSHGAVTGLFLALVLPGSTGIVMIPTPGELGIEPEVQTRVTTAGLERLRARKLHYAQALLLPQAAGQRRALEQLGFRPLAPLLYLEREATYPWVDPPASGAVTWLPFGKETRADFAGTVLATYEDSLDCPELAHLRPIDDILAAHQASGVFDPDLWELAQLRDGSDRKGGCLLLARLPHAAAVEVVYMGVVPVCRGRGVGSLLLRRALQRCRAVGARRLTLVVDERNQPARRLYQRFGLRLLARREALLYRWLRSSPAPPATA